MRGARHKFGRTTSYKAAQVVSIGSNDKSHTAAASCAFTVRIQGYKDVGVVAAEEGVLLVGCGSHMFTRYSNRKPRDSFSHAMDDSNIRLDKIGEINFGCTFRCEIRRAESCSTFLQEAGLRG